MSTVQPQRESHAWSCTSCNALNAIEHLYCPLCLVSRPMEKRGVPQIFSGLGFHFNGIIPRSLKHPSHSVEWRMAERAGAKCAVEFDLGTLTTLIYRPGYERSDKVKLCVERHPSAVNTVSINWMLDSLLQSRQIHPSLYRLSQIPAVALPTVKGTILPHHQHPFYVVNADEYTIVPLPQQQQTRMVLKSRTEAGDVEPPPKAREIPAPQWACVSILEAAANATTAEKSKEVATDDDVEEFENTARRGTKGIEVLKDAKNRRNPKLFAGIVFALSEAIATNATVKTALTNFGAKVVDVDASGYAASIKEARVTHVLFDHDDKKSDMMISATVLVETEGAAAPVFCETCWVEDCLTLDELLPCTGPYVPTAKLLATLAKKRSKR